MQKNTVQLPQELIIEILLRLPVKSLVRSRCVCKSWLSIISDSHFAISHFELAAARTERLVFLAPSAPETLSIDFNASFHDDSASAALKLNLLIPNTCYYNVYIIGSCRGFLLLDLNDILCVWNPSTGVYKNVYWSPIQSSTMSFRYSIFLRGFGYDPSTNDYLVVLASCKRDHWQDDSPTRVEFFSLRANEWKEIESTNLSYEKCTRCMDNEAGSFLDGSIHWLAFNWDVLMIVAFDLRERSFSEIPLPVDFEYDNFRICLLGVFGELLGLCTVGWNHSTEIWVMKEYKVQSSWTKTIVVSVDHIPTRYFFPICSTKGGDIVGTDGRTGLAKFNNKGQLQERQSYCNDGDVFRVAVYTESLLSLPCL